MKILLVLINFLILFSCSSYSLAQNDGDELLKVFNKEKNTYLSKADSIVRLLFQKEQILKNLYGDYSLYKFDYVIEPEFSINRHVFDEVDTTSWLSIVSHDFTGYVYYKDSLLICIAYKHDYGAGLLYPNEHDLKDKSLSYYNRLKIRSKLSEDLSFLVNGFIFFTHYFYIKDGKIKVINDFEPVIDQDAKKYLTSDMNKVYVKELIEESSKIENQK